MRLSIAFLLLLVAICAGQWTDCRCYPTSHYRHRSNPRCCGTPAAAASDGPTTTPVGQAECSRTTERLIGAAGMLATIVGLAVAALVIYQCCRKPDYGPVTS